MAGNRRKHFIRRLCGLLLACLCLAGGLWLYMTRVEPNWVEVTGLEMEGAIDGVFRAVAFGDTHIGMAKDIEDLRTLVAQINSLAPDAVLFLGDLYDDYSTYAGDAEADMAVLAGLEAAHKFAVRGNHDVGGGAEFVYSGLMEKAGFTLLENQAVTLPCGVRVVGAADYIYHSPNVAALLTDGFDLLLAHEPDLADAVTGAELQLSGHSHGGQVFLPFLLDRILPAGAEVYYRGEYRKTDGGVVYVNRGLGMSLLPVRLFSRPEITVVTVRGTGR